VSRFPVILRTACGCESRPQVVDALTWRVPLLSRESFVSSPSIDPTLMEPIRVRDFQWRGKREITSGGTQLHVLEEVGCSLALKPEAPRPLSTGEWADAVARVSDFCRGPEWYQNEIEFMRRHDGATMVQHKSGALIGAFYPAPSWDNAHDFAQLLAALRAVIERDPGDDEATSG